MEASINNATKNKDGSVLLTGLNLNLPNINVLMSGYKAETLYKSYSELSFIIPEKVDAGIHTIMVYRNDKKKVYFSNNVEIEIENIGRSVNPLPIYQA